jgi:hypothetical protein
MRVACLALVWSPGLDDLEGCWWVRRHRVRIFPRDAVHGAILGRWHRSARVNVIKNYATLRGETPLFGGAFAYPFASLTGISRRGENAISVFSEGRKG